MSIAKYDNKTIRQGIAPSYAGPVSFHLLSASGVKTNEIYGSVYYLRERVKKAFGQMRYLPAGVVKINPTFEQVKRYWKKADILKSRMPIAYDLILTGERS